MTSKTISINRAPVLTLWAAVVAERLGFDEDEGLSLGKALAGLTAQTKGRRLGIYKPHEEGAKEAREKERGEEFWIELCGRPLPAKNTEDEQDRGGERPGVPGVELSLMVRSPTGRQSAMAPASGPPSFARSAPRAATRSRLTGRRPLDAVGSLSG